MVAIAQDTTPSKQLYKGQHSQSQFSKIMTPITSLTKVYKNRLHGRTLAYSPNKSPDRCQTRIDMTTKSVVASLHVSLIDGTPDQKKKLSRPP